MDSQGEGALPSSQELLTAPESKPESRRRVSSSAPHHRHFFPLHNAPLQTFITFLFPFWTCLDHFYYVPLVEFLYDEKNIYTGGFACC